MAAVSEAPINYHAIPMEEMAKVGWRYWQAKRKGLDYPINPKFVPWGYYRYKKKDGESIPLAVWEDKGKKYYRFGTARIEPMGDAQQEAAWAYNVFQYVCGYPISKAEYEHWMQHKAWPDPHGVQAAVEASKPAPKSEPAKPATMPAPAAPIAKAEIGHNSGDTEPMLTPEDAAGRVKVVIEAARKFTAITTQEEADASVALTNRLRELATEADKRRAELKKPHWEAGKAIDEAWNPVVIAPANHEASRLTSLRSKWAQVEKTKREMAARAEQARLDKEASERRAAAPIDAEPEARKVVEAAPVVMQAPGGGRKRTARTIRGARITDYDALVEAVKGYQSVRTFLQEVADKVYYAGSELPGCEEDLRVRG